MNARLHPPLGDDGPPKHDHGYDPRACGARCDECPLKEHTPVPPEFNPGSIATIVCEAPDQNAERIGLPLVGKAADEFELATRPHGAFRRNFSFVNVLACRPPKNRLNVVLAKVKRQNREIKKQNTRRVKLGLAALPLALSPMECCHPRLVHDLVEGVKVQQDPSTVRVLPMGPVALRWTLGMRASHKDVAGGMLDGRLYVRTDGAGYPELRFLQPDRPGDELPADGVPFQGIATYDPGYILRKRRFTRAFRAHVARALRWFRGDASFKEPDIVWHPKAEALYKFLYDNPRPLTFDIETDKGVVPGHPDIDPPFFESTWARIRCIGIGDTENVALIGIASKFLDSDGNTTNPWYTPAELEQVKAVLRHYFTDPKMLKIGHNAGVFDRLVVWAQLGVDPSGTQKPDDLRILDTLILHKAVESELPHNLAFVASVYAAAVKAWKADREGRKKATDAENDDELGRYCGIDVAMAHTVARVLSKQVELRQQSYVVSKDHAVQRICGEMHIAGFYVDQKARQASEQEAINKLLMHRNQCRKLSGRPDFNPGSPTQWREVLFDEWGLRPNLESEASILRSDEDWHTAAGDPSTGDAVFRELLKLPDLEPHQRNLIRTGRLFRSTQKQLGTYIAKLRPITDRLDFLGKLAVDADVWASDEARAEEEYRREKNLPKRGITHPDGRFRAGYNVLPVTGRLNSSNPINAMNFPKALRRLVRAAPGHIFVAADADQLELRIAAARWGIQQYLEAFANGIDPHGSVTALAVFGERFTLAAGCAGPWPSGFDYPKAANEMRNLAKRVQYGGQYGAEIPTLTRVIQEAEDKNGELIYLLMGQPEVRLLYNNWLDGVPEYKIGWEKEQQDFRRRGFTFEPIHGRRRDCLDGPEANKIINFPVQSSAAAWINDAMIKITDEIPLYRWGPGTGLVTQTHDEMVLEVPIDGCRFEPHPKTGRMQWTMPLGTPARYAADVIEWAMNGTHPSLPGVVLTAGASASLTWDMKGDIGLAA